jgi:hypothetical protein
VPNRLDLRPAPQTRDVEDGEHDQCQAEAVHQQRHRPSTPEARGRPPYQQKDGGEEEESAHDDELDLLDPAGEGCSGRDGEEAVRVDPEQDLHELQSDCGRVPGDDDQTADASHHASGRVGEEHVQEHRRRRQVEQMTDGEQHGHGRPLQGGQGHHETGGDHQRTEPARRAAPPGEGAADQVRDGDPVEEQCLQAWPDQLVPCHRERDGDDQRAETRDDGRPQRPRPRSAGRFDRRRRHKLSPTLYSPTLRSLPRAGNAWARNGREVFPSVTGPPLCVSRRYLVPKA